MKCPSQKFALVKNKFFKLFSFVFTLLTLQNSHAQLSGTVFKDYNGSGTQTATKPYEPGVSGVTVRLFVGNSTTPVTVTTTANGTYSFTAVQAPKDSMARIEFANLPDAYAAGMVGSQSMSELRFLKLPSTGINLGITTDDEYCESGKGLTIATPCFVNGDPLAGGTAGEADAFIQFDYNASGQAGVTNYPPAHLATAKQVGSIWASTYQKASEQLVLAAMVRRHVGLGPLGTGGMYKLDLKTTAITNFLDVKTIGIDTGPDPHSGLPANKEGQSHDSLTYIMACKVGMGGVQFSRYQDTMFVVNQYDKKLYNFLVNKPLTAPNNTTAKLKSRPIPHPNCSNNDFAPWSLKQYKGKLYLGVVCTAETSQDTNDLKAAVYEFNTKTDVFTKVLEFPLNFRRDPIDATGPDCFKLNRWYPWTNKFPLSCSGIGYGPNFIMYPQPLLSDIEFDDDGSMILGFVDRFGFQAGQGQYGIAKSDTVRYNGFMSGDTYRAQLTPTGFMLESNGKSGDLIGCGAGKGTGPGGGEFFCDDEWFLKLTSPPAHQEITNGGMFKQPGVQEVLVSAMDPVNEVFLSTGFRALSTLNGKMSRGYSLYSDQAGTLGKSGGVGDLTGLCAPAPLEIGNRVWYDKNKNGVQDASEKGIDGLIITLHDMAAGGSAVAKDTTANGGQYYFNDQNITGGILRRHNYQVRMSMKQMIPAGLLSGTGMLKDSLNVTVLNATGFADPQIRDSNAKSIGDSLVVPILTQESGENDYTFDIGLNSRVASKGSLGDYVWKDVNNDGKQDATDIPQKGVIIELYKNNTLVGKDTTDAMGKYLFANLDSATYCIKVVASSLAPGCVISPKQAFAGVADSLNSDMSPVTFKSQNVIIDPTPIAGVSKKDNLGLDVGLVALKGSLGDYVWKDVNNDGKQDATDIPQKGVIIELYKNNTLAGKDTTDAMGKYLFVSLDSATYCIKVVASSLAPGCVISSKQAFVGVADSLNSDVSPVTFKSQNVIIDPTPIAGVSKKDNLGIDVGFVALKGSLGDYVWKDVNNDGKQDATDIPQKGVIIELYKNNTLVGKDTTDAMGKYLFADLDSATYCIKVVASSLAPGCVISPKQAFAGVPDSLNSDVSPVTFKSQNVIIDPTPIAGVSKKDNGFIDVALYYDCVKPVFTLTPQSATCNGSTANSDAKILVSNVSNGASYVFGTDSTAFKYTDAVSFSNNSFNISNLTNPTTAKTYFVRIYNGVADCYATKPVVIQPTNCTLPCVKPSFTLTPASATCSGNTANNDAKILVTGASNGLTYSFGADSTAFTFTSATAYSGNGFNIINIANPTTAKTYFVRIYNGKLDCYTTKMVVIQPTTCNTSCIKPSFILTPSSASCNGTIANNDAKIFITGASNGSTWIYGADSTTFTFAASTVYSGNSITVNGISNPTMAKTYFVRIYNGTANCYTTKMVTIQPTDCSEPCIKPSFKLISSSATCNGMTANNDAQIVVSGASNGLTYTYGTDSTTFNFGASTAYTGNSFSIKNIPNSLISKTYFVRIYNGAAGCYITKSVVIKATDCSINFDLELTKTVVGDCKRKIGDIVQYKVVVRNVPILNGSTADSVYVSDTLAANLTFKSAKATRGTYDNVKHIWGMLQIPQGGSDTLTITAQINANAGFEGGSICNVAQIQKARGKDINSTPGNNVKTENDYGIACVSVPMKLCSARKDTLIITAPEGYEKYQWFKNDVKITGATKSTLEVGAAGDYRVEVSGGNCITKNCCPAYVIDFCECPVDICVPFVIKKTKAKGIPINSIVR